VYAISSDNQVFRKQILQEEYKVNTEFDSSDNVDKVLADI